MDERLKALMQELDNAINDTLSESESIAQVIGEIKKEGYDVCLTINATIGFEARAEKAAGRVHDDAFPPDDPSR